MNQQQQQSGDQEPRQQPLYDISQGGHYGKCKRVIAGTIALFTAQSLQVSET
jgi:hypothetical protein